MSKFFWLWFLVVAFSVCASVEPSKNAEKCSPERIKFMKKELTDCATLGYKVTDEPETDMSLRDVCGVSGGDDRPSSRNPGQGFAFELDSGVGAFAHAVQSFKQKKS
jgi:hypothetical protein